MTPHVPVRAMRMEAMSTGRAKNNQLGEFLQARRAELTPEMVGLPTIGSHRRVAGLRREEVAQLAALSTDYYTRLEQGRLAGASISALHSLAQALRLSPDQTSYLYQLAHKITATTRKRPSRQINPQTRRLLDNLTDSPALVLDRVMNVLAWNSLAVALYIDFAALAPAQRNLLRLTFLDDYVRSLHADWETSARDSVSFLRMDAAQSPDAPALHALVGELSVCDHDFRRWWASHDVAHRSFGTKRFSHPVAGNLTLDWQVLGCLHDPDQFVYVMTAEPGSASEQGLRFLASWVTEHPQHAAENLQPRAHEEPRQR